MYNYAFVCLVCIALLMSLVIGVYTLIRSQSYKKNYFLLMQTMVIVFLFGYLLELTSNSAEEAYTAVRVLYVGAYFVPVMTFFFLADYCNLRLHPVLVKTPMLLLSLASIVAMWTTRFHHLVYVDYHLDSVGNHLAFTPGPIYSIIHAYPTGCMILTMLVLLHQLNKWANRYRKQLLLFLLCLVVPFIAEGLYYITLVTGVFSQRLYLTPLSMAIMSLCLYIGVMRFNIFEIISIATVTAMEHIREGFILVDENNSYLSSNTAAVRILPGITKLIKGETVFSTKDWPSELKDVESGSVEFSISDREIRYYRASISPVFAGNRSLVAKIILFSDITDNVNLMKELENAAYIDSLTGLYNRKHFFELAYGDIERAHRNNESIYTAMLDLDFFKQVNDTHGHAAGDMVLKLTAEIIHQTIRSYDLVGRYGGEEFVLLITNLDAVEAHKLMERIRENMEHSIANYEELELKVTCSIGLVKFTEGDTLESSIKKADEALYAAKKAGRNLVKVYGENK